MIHAYFFFVLSVKMSFSEHHHPHLNGVSGVVLIIRQYLVCFSKALACMEASEKKREIYTQFCDAWNSQ